MNLGAAFAGGNGKRREGDFYPTPPEATLALLQVEGAYMPQRIWEPACGDGAISRSLAMSGRVVHSTDLVDRGFGQGGVDFLSSTEMVAGGIVTNPPFKLAAEFIAKAIDHSEYVAMLLKVSFWNAHKRLSLYDAHPPARLYPLTWRLDFDGRGAPTMDCMWVVWDDRRAGDRVYQPIEHPSKGMFG